MAYLVVYHAYRKPGMTPQAFKAHYEDVHVPLLEKIAGPLFPLAHKRLYISRPGSSSTKPEDDDEFPPEVIGGSPSVFPHDAIVEMTFENQEAWQKFGAVLAQPENHVVLAEDCALFLDVTRAPDLVVIGDVCETSRA